MMRLTREINFLLYILIAMIVYVSDLPVAWLLVATAAAGYSASKLIPLLSGRATLQLPLMKFLPAFIPLFMAMIIFMVLSAGFLSLLRREILFVLAIAAMLITRYKLDKYKLEIIWPKPDRYWLWLLPACVMLIAGVGVFLLFAPAQWDVMTYHLYIPVRWLQSARIVHVPTFYGDEAAAFAPGNAAAIYAWALALLNSDMLTNVSSTAFLLFLSLLTALIVQKFTGNRTVSYLLASIVIVAPVMFFKAFSGYTDLMAQSLLVAGVWWLLEYLKNSSTEYRYASLYSALCLGLAIGCKTVILPLAAPVILLFLAVCGYRRQWKSLMWSVIIIICAGGWWYLRNWWLFCNPLFPAQIKVFDNIIFEGLYDFAGLTTGPGHLNSWKEIFSKYFTEYGIVMALLLPLGWTGWLVRIVRVRADRFQAGVILTLSILWTLLFCKVIPYNDQFRFLIGAWVIALPGIAFLLNLIRVEWIKATIGGLTLLWLIFQDATGLLALLNGIPLVSLVVIAGISIVAIGIISYWRKRSKIWLCCGAIVLVLTLMQAESESGKLRIVTMSKTNIGAFKPLFTPFNVPHSPPLVIAWSGVNIPYIFAGQHFQNQVVFCNLSGSITDNSYDFWNRNGRKVFSFNGPKFYQLNPSLQDWLRNLRDSNAQILITMQLHPFEYNFHYHNENGLPLESIWAEKLPAIFQPWINDKVGKAYLIDREELQKALAKAGTK